MRELISQSKDGRRNQRGFTLIEVMVSVVVLSIGLLGIAVMEDIALTRNVDARYLTVATNLAAEMVDRIRYNSPANATVLLAPPIPASPYLYNGMVACRLPVGVAVGSPCPYPTAQYNIPSSPGNAAGILPLTFATAQSDYNQWFNHFQTTDSNGLPLLPNGVGTVTSTALTPADPMGQVLVQVVVAWTSGLRRPAITMSTVVSPL